MEKLLREMPNLTRSFSNFLVVSGNQVSCRVFWEQFYVAHETLEPF